MITIKNDNNMEMKDIIHTKLRKNNREKFAKKENLTGIRMETWNFQAREFYEKNGYIVFAEIKDCPPQTTCYFLKKEC